MDYECKIEDRAAQPTVAIRTRTPAAKLPEVMGPAYGQIMAYLGSQGAFPAGPPYSGYYNMDMDDLDVEIGMPVAQPLAGQGNVQASKIPAGRVASTVHTGPYDEFGNAYNALEAFMDEQGVEGYFREQDGQGNVIAYELYLNDPGEVTPEQLRTLILIPLK